MSTFTEFDSGCSCRGVGWSAFFFFNLTTVLFFFLNERSMSPSYYPDLITIGVLACLFAIRWSGVSCTIYSYFLSGVA
jgi:hypothetical protein